jgi:anthranilate phosphoribosyltransferase
LVARALGMLGAERAWVVHGAGRLDEVSTIGHTKVSELQSGAVHTFYIHPSDVGIEIADRSELSGGSADENAGIIREILAGEHGARRDIVLLNTGACLLVAGRAGSLEEGLRAAAASIDSGAARGALERLRRVCGR